MYKIDPIYQTCDIITFDLKIIRNHNIVSMVDLSPFKRENYLNIPLHLYFENFIGKKIEHEIHQLPIEVDEWEFQILIPGNDDSYILCLPPEYVIIQVILPFSDISVNMEISDGGLHYIFRKGDKKEYNLSVKMVLNEELYKDHIALLSNIKKKTKLLSEVFHDIKDQSKPEINHLHIDKIIIKSVGGMLEVSINNRTEIYKKESLIMILMKCIIDGPISEKGKDGKGVGLDEYNKMRDRVRYFFYGSKRKSENDKFIKNELRKLIIQSDGSIHLQKNIFNLDRIPKASDDIMEITQISFSFYSNPD